MGKSEIELSGSRITVNSADTPRVTRAVMPGGTQMRITQLPEGQKPKQRGVRIDASTAEELAVPLSLGSVRIQTRKADERLKQIS